MIIEIWTIVEIEISLVEITVAIQIPRCSMTEHVTVKGTVTIPVKRSEIPRLTRIKLLHVRRVRLLRITLITNTLVKKDSSPIVSNGTSVKA